MYKHRSTLLEPPLPFEIQARSNNSNDLINGYHCGNTKLRILGKHLVLLVTLHQQLSELKLIKSIKSLRVIAIKAC